MVEKILSFFGYKIQQQRFKNIFYVTTNNFQEEEFPQTFVNDGYVSEPLIQTYRKRVSFNPDESAVLTIRHMNLAHQVYTVDQELGRRGEFPYFKGPPDEEEIRFLREGLCFWHDKTETYRLAYPYNAVKSIFNECKEEITDKYYLKLELRDFFQEILCITYEVNNIIDEDGLDEDKLKEIYDEYDLSVFEYTCKGNILSIACSRTPKWIYADNTCLYHVYGGSNCKKLTGGKYFCHEHDTPENHRIIKTHRKQRAKLRNQEYLNYIKKPLPLILSLGDIKLIQLSYSVD